MAYGIKIYGDAGDLVIDDDYESYVFLGNYTLTFTGDGTDPYAKPGPLYPVYHNYRCDIVSTTRPLIFYKPPLGDIQYDANLNPIYPYFGNNMVPGLAMVALQNIGGNTWRAYFVAPWLGLGGNTTLKVFASTKTRGASNSTIGIRTYNGAGNLTFDSGWNILNPTLASGSLTRMQNNVSNAVGTSIIFNATTDTHPNVGGTGAWITAYTREPTIISNFQPNTALAYYYVFKVFTQFKFLYPGVTYDPGTGGGLYAWPASINFGVPNFTYNIVLGSNQDTQITYLIIPQYIMQEYFP